MQYPCIFFSFSPLFLPHFFFSSIHLYLPAAHPGIQQPLPPQCTDEWTTRRLHFLSPPLTLSCFVLASEKTMCNAPPPHLHAVLPSLPDPPQASTVVGRSFPGRAGVAPQRAAVGRPLPSLPRWPHSRGGSSSSQLGASAWRSSLSSPATSCVAVRRLLLPARGGLDPGHGMEGTPAAWAMAKPRSGPCHWRGGTTGTAVPRRGVPGSASVRAMARASGVPHRGRREVLLRR